ncbi:hypothetical protein [Bradyrhizobium sp. NC92]|uniref:hypothetical protein n=1 Tax=Bradyrhizobium sp. (strain NC92) TaxID=55395 RepID=UPI0021AA00B5|nr:hypothetical protein [Bradyrhizobium sp. NC92]UWU72967.1 hypothetical protein N2602_34290 [Bradyrhizobium sp. NC92]
MYRFASTFQRANANHRRVRDSNVLSLLPVTSIVTHSTLVHRRLADVIDLRKTKGPDATPLGMHRLDRATRQSRSQPRH